MYCPNCGKKNEDAGNFCDACGNALTKNIPRSEPARSQTDPQTDDSTVPESAKRLWKKFLEIVRAEGEEEKKFKDLTSDAVWEVLSRFGQNSTNTLLEAFKIDFDKQPYKTVEATRTYITVFAHNGYHVFIAEKLTQGEAIKRADIQDVEVLVEEWQRVARNNASNIIAIPEDISTVLNAINAQATEGLFGDNKSLEDLPKAAVDAIKDGLIRQLVDGYLLGYAENNLRQK